MGWIGHIGTVIALFFSGLFGGHASVPATSTVPVASTEATGTTSILATTSQPAVGVYSSATLGLSFQYPPTWGAPLDAFLHPESERTADSFNPVLAYFTNNIFVREGEATTSDTYAQAILTVTTGYGNNFIGFIVTDAADDEVYNPGLRVEQRKPSALFQYTGQSPDAVCANPSEFLKNPKEIITLDGKPYDRSLTNYLVKVDSCTVLQGHGVPVALLKGQFEPLGFDSNVEVPPQELRWYAFKAAFVQTKSVEHPGFIMYYFNLGNDTKGSSIFDSIVLSLKRSSVESPTSHVPMPVITAPASSTSLATPSQPVQTIPTGDVIGYVWTSEPGSPKFASVIIPAWGQLGSADFNTHEYSVYILENGSYTFYQKATALHTITFPAGGVSQFKVLGVDPALGICAPDHNVTWGITFSESGLFQGNRIALTTDAPDQKCVAEVSQSTVGQ